MRESDSRRWEKKEKNGSEEERNIGKKLIEEGVKGLEKNKEENENKRGKTLLL